MKVQDTPGWLTVTVDPATVNAPERATDDGFAVALNVTVPVPVPLAPAVTLSQLALLVADQLHPAVVVTVVVPLAPAAATDGLRGATLKPHAAPACVTVNVEPAIVIVPVRGVVAALAGTLKPTVPAPLPVAPEVTVIQEALLTDVQPHPDAAVTVTEPVPAPAAID